MEELHVALCINVGKYNWRKYIIGPVLPTRGMGYRFNVGDANEFCIKVKFVYCDVDDDSDQVEGQIGSIWAEADLPKDVTIAQLETAGFEKYSFWKKSYHHIRFNTSVVFNTSNFFNSSKAIVGDGYSLTQSIVRKSSKILSTWL